MTLDSGTKTDNGRMTGESHPAPLGGLTIERHFSDPDVLPADQVEWDTRTARITDESGGVVFEQQVHAPAGWSDQAVKVVASKYFYGDAAKGFDPRKGGRESSVGDPIGRVSHAIAKWGQEDGYFATKEDGDRFRDELEWFLLNQHGSFNSPVWFNVGLADSYGIKGGANGWVWDDDPNPAASEMGLDVIPRAVKCKDAYISPQCSACFIVSVEDNMDSILERAKTEGLLFKYGSGVGADNSTIRSTQERLSSGGRPSGPVSFMRIYDAVAGQVKSGGAVRRAAKMETLKVTHPDIMEFIGIKANEDRKAKALVVAGYSGGMNGEASATVGFQNANLSVRATDRFMRMAAGEEIGEFWTQAVTTGKPVEALDPLEILYAISEGTWACGDPGMQFEDTIQRWHTCPNTAPINSSNPCSEYMFIDDSACNLASLNLMKFLRPDGSFDVDRFRAACRIFLIAQDILVDRASYPTAKICENSHRFRPLGLGYCGLGALLMASGLPYDSDEGRSMGGAITAIMHGQANLTSAEMAEKIGVFDGFAVNREPMLKVMGMHASACIEGRKAAHVVFDKSDDAYALWREAEGVWKSVRANGESHGYRNSQVTVLAPTGTIAFMMDSGHSTGMEPGIAIVQYKTLAGGGMLKIVNPVVPMALKSLGYDDPSIAKIIRHIETNDTIEDSDTYHPDGSPGPWRQRSGLNPDHLHVFDCAFPPRSTFDGDGNEYRPREGRSISWHGHVKMMASLQPFLSGAISKTVNLPKDATVADIRAAYIEAWKSGIKAVAIFRDGSKESQPVSTSKATANETARPPVGGQADGDAKIATREDIKGVYGEGVAAGLALGGHDTAANLAEEILNLRSEIGHYKALYEGSRSTTGPRRERLPDTRRSLTHKLSVAEVEAYMTVGEFPDGRPGELFVEIAKEGSTLGGLMDVWATAISLMLQYGVPLDVIVAKFSGGRFEPAGMTRNPEIPIASSLPDYVVRWMAMEYLAGYREANVPRRDGEGAAEPGVARAEPGADRTAINGVTTKDSITFRIPGSWNTVTVEEFKAPDHGIKAPAAHGPLCPTCGGMTIPTGRCWTCSVCATSVGGCG